MIQVRAFLRVRNSRLTLNRLFHCVGLLLVASLLPVESSAACINPNPNPNPASFAAPRDFDGDCKSDILWRNNITGGLSVWLLNGTAHGSTGTFAGPSGTWSTQGIGDFDGDGKADILWRNDTTGGLSVWLMNGTTRGAGGPLGGPDLTWSIQGVSDFDGDGKADILWRNDITGSLSVWLMNGAARGASGTFAGPLRYLERSGGRGLRWRR